MAKLGEGDERWLVKDMGAEGQNVNNWHWREYDAMEWSQRRLKAVFEGQDLLPAGNCKLKITTVSCKGEAVLNNRKNKLIPAYELEVVLQWQGEAAGGTSAKGRIMLPYISDEQDDEEPEVKFSSETDDEATAQLREAFRGEGKKVSGSRVAMHA
jgi:activator of HSP90 ATPase